MSATNQTIEAACLQFDVRTGDPQANLAAVRRGVERIVTDTPPALVVLPELWATGFAYGRLPELAGRTPELLAELQQLAGQHALLFAGSLAEATESGIHNTLFFVDASGTIGRYRKQQLFAPMHEDQHFLAGDRPRPVATPLGLAGGLVCYDLRFPDLAAVQTAAGARLLVVSAQWPAERLGHWRLLVRARAVENQVFCIACNRCGTTAGTSFAGHSCIVAPDGTVLAEANDTETTLTASLDLALQETIRRRFQTAGRTPYRFADADKILSWDRAQELVARNRRTGRTTVFTNGCFDILHAGHVTYLEEARRLGDCLVVGLNSDASIQRLKGPCRPVNPETDRARVLAGLGCVDAVVLFGEDTPLELIKTLGPDVLVKGADWEEGEIAGGAEVRAAGGRVVTIPLVAGRSTTGIIERIRNAGRGPSGRREGDQKDTAR